MPGHSEPMSDAPVTPPGPAGSEPDGGVADAEPMSFGRRSGRILALVVGVAIAALWAYALWGPTEKNPPGLLSNKDYAAQFQSICTETANQIGALPPAKSHDEHDAKRAVHETIEMIVAAGRHFNRGQRAFFFALAYMGWFLGPVAFLVFTACVLVAMYRRQFASDAARVFSHPGTP